MTSTCPAGSRSSTEASEDWARTTVICGLRPGQQLRIVKYLAYGWSSLRSRPALRDQVAAAIAGAQYTGWQGLLDAQRDYLDDFWDSADVEVEGDADCQQAVRFGLFHVLQASARAERRAIPGKGLTGTGYDGHAFWDTEGFVLPVLTYTAPYAAADALRWRASTLDLARERAARARSRRRHLSVAHHPTARSARRTGRPAPRRGTSMPTSPWRSSAIALSLAMIRWRPSAVWTCSSKRLGCGCRWDITTDTASGTSTVSPVLTSTRPSSGTTSSPT